MKNSKLLRISILGFFIAAFFTSAEAGVYLGVFREGAPRNMNYIHQFAQQTGKNPAMIMWYQDWAQVFPKDEAMNVINYGAVPHIVWEPWYWSDHEKIKLSDITSAK